MLVDKYMEYVFYYRISLGEMSCTTAFTPALGSGSVKYYQHQSWPPEQVVGVRRAGIGLLKLRCLWLMEGRLEYPPAKRGVRPPGIFKDFLPWKLIFTSFLLKKILVKQQSFLVFLNGRYLGQKITNIKNVLCVKS